MHRLAEEFFSSAEAKRVQEAVAQAEARSAGEIVVMVLPASHAYPEAQLRAALLLALPSALLPAYLISSALWRPELMPWLFLAIFCVAVLLLRRLAVLMPSLLRPFIAPEAAAFEVEREAILSFYRENLHRTRRATGVLIFFSVLEQRVWILADSGIDAVLPQALWQELMQDLTSGIRARRQADATVQAVERIGTLLQEYFPPDPEDSNELRDLMIKGEHGFGS